MQIADYIHIQWTCRDVEEAKRIINELLEKKWVACANVFPHVDSLYMWKGKLCEEAEVKVVFKTTDIYFAKVSEYILLHGTYDIPEICKIQIFDANPQYTAWLHQTLNP